MTPPMVPNGWRLALARMFAECEQLGLGTWSPTFQAHPGKEAEAAVFIEGRTALVSDEELAWPS